MKTLSVIVRGPTYAPFGKPITVEVHIEGSHATAGSSEREAVREAVEAAIGAYLKAAEDNRKPDELVIEDGGAEHTQVTHASPAGILRASFTPRSPALDEADLEAIREEPVDVSTWRRLEPPEAEVVPDPGVLAQPGIVPPPPSERCGRIGEHEPHAWGLEGTRWCGGEVF